MLPTKEISRIAQERFAAYETGEVARVMAVYADDVSYWDTTCAERIRGRDDLQAHLGDFLRRVDVRYALLEEHRLDGRDSAIVLWECAARPRLPDGRPGEQLQLRRGMNLLQVQDGLVTREESYMDMASLDALFPLQVKGHATC